MAESLQAPQCGVCLDEINAVDRIYIGRDNDNICTDCFNQTIVPKFRNALETESQYDNARWSDGNEHLKARDFINFLGEEFVKKYEQKEKEYRVRVSDRAYCRRTLENEDPTKVRECGTFVGSKTELAELSEVVCPECHGVVVNEGGDEGEEEDPFAGLERGKDYQRCPDCDWGAILHSGCNYMRCRGSGCNGGFCMLCGGKTNHSYRQHWQRGNPTGCTLFGPAEKGLYADPVDEENKTEYAVLELAILKRTLLKVLSREDATLPTPGWFTDPSLTDEWVILCGYSTGPAFPGYTTAKILDAVPKEGYEPSLAGYDATWGFRYYFETHPRRFSNVLVEYAAHEDFNRVQQDEAENLVPVDRAHTIQKLLLARKRDTTWTNPYHSAPFSEFLGAIQTVLRTGGNTSLQAAEHSWTAQLPPSGKVIYRHRDDPKTFKKGHRAILQTLWVQPKNQRQDNLIEKFEKWLSDSSFFDACVLEYLRQSDLKEPEANWENALQYSR